MRNKLWLLIICVTAMLMGLCLISCGAKLVQLETPVNLSVDDLDILTWDSVEGATSYVVDINGEEYETEENSLDIFLLTAVPGTYSIKVVAYGKMDTHLDSEWSDAVEYKVSDFFTNGLTVEDKADWSVAGETTISVAIPAYISGKVAIPDKLNNVYVSAIEKRAFKDCTKLTGVIIPDTVNEIGFSAFEGCANLRRVHYSKNVSEIPHNCFSGCTNLERIDNFGKLESVGNSAFHQCEKLKEIKLPDTVTYFGGRAFGYCHELEHVEYSDNVLSMGIHLFHKCRNLKSVYIPASLKTLYPDIVDGCSGLEEVIVSKDNPYYVGDGNCAIRKADNMLVIGASKSVIPSYVTKIGMCAFTHRKIDSLVIHNGVTEIGFRAFSYGTLKSIDLPASVNSIDRLAFAGCNDLERVTVSDENPTYKSAGNCIIRREDNVVVAGCKTSVIPEYVKGIERAAFYWLSELKEINLPYGLRFLGDSAFKLTSIESVFIPESVVSIGECALPVGIKSATITTSVEEIRTEAFTGVTLYIDAVGKFPSGWFGGSIGLDGILQPSFFLCGIVVGCEMKSDDGYPYVNSFVWNENVWYSGGLDLSAEEIAIVEDRHDNPRVPERKGYTFKGWATEEGGKPVYLPYKTANGDTAAFSLAEREATPLGTKLYAVWEKN